jgi:cellobiose-specific phosphotransferase system component IIB
MKKFLMAVVFSIMSLMLMVSTGCTPAIQKAGEVAYNGAMVTSSSLRVYDRFEEVNDIILAKLPEFTSVERVTIKTVSVNFNQIKKDFDKLTNKSADIYKVTMNIDDYLDYYVTIEADYMKVKKIIDANIDKFTEAEIKVLKAFDADAQVLHAQVQIVKTKIMNTAEEKDIDITAIMEKTYNIVKAFSTIAIMF